MKSRILVAMFMGIFLLVGFSGHAHYGRNKSQVSQRQRIIEGRMQGEINHHEAMRLRNQQQRICRSKQIAKLDGRVTPKERRRLHAMQRNANRSICRAKHNSF